MRDYLEIIKNTRSWIITYGLIFFGSIGFIYSNFVIFSMIKNEGGKIPPLLIQIFNSWSKWIIVISILLMIELGYGIYLSRRKK